MASSRNNALEFSSAGSIILDGANHATAGVGSYGAIQILKDSTLSGIAGNDIINIDELDTAFVAGTILYGRFTNVTVASGGLIAVHRV
tara:strand:+ start:863 stop:1126 length:264 start_codon:yes stop_codon:yes gene_type:complete